MADAADRLAAAARAAVGRLFGRAKIRMGLVAAPRGDKRLYVTVDRRFTIPGLYEGAVREGGAVPRASAAEVIRRVAAGYMDSHQEAAQAAVTRVVDGVVRGAKGVMTPEVRGALRDALEGVLTRLTAVVERVANTEATAARNLGSLEAVGQIAAARGDRDPTVYFVVVRDGYLCEECKRLHMLEDGVTPRVWKLSELDRGYHKRGGPAPSVLGLHPNCRCTQTILLPGYGFGAGGGVRFVAPDHDEYARQRGG